MFQKNYQIIHTGIQSSVQDLARREHARGLIPEQVRSTVLDASNHWTKYQRTDAFMEGLHSKIKIDPMALISFIDVLRESGAYYSTLIKTISEFCVHELCLY